MVSGSGGSSVGSGARATRMNFRANERTNPATSSLFSGTRPTPQPASIKEVMTVMLLHVCKKSIFFDTNIKVALYLASLFLVSLLADVFTFPKSYFSRSDNLFNQYFVKIGWFWTLTLTVPFVAMTSYTYCCGRRGRILKGHLTRLAIATVMWYCWIGFFSYIENTYGKCIPKSYANKQLCLKNGHFWNGFDISGHCFILIYSSLVLIEEARAIVGWDCIKEHLRDEEYARSVDDRTVRSNPLRYLSNEELYTLKESHVKFTPYIRTLFVGMTFLQLLWDVMLFCTLMYYHIMVEKFISGALAILMWYVTYRAWYRMPKYFPNLPGEGIFKYNKEKTLPTSSTGSKKRASVINNGKHFMGMPLYGNKSQDLPDSTSEPMTNVPR